MLRFFFNLFKRNSSYTEAKDVDLMKKYLIVGLGNIGTQYQNTRHNIGFKILDFLAEKESLIFETQKLGDVTIYKFKGRHFILLKPSTYMNLSGKSVVYWLTKENVPLENLYFLLLYRDKHNLTLFLSSLYQ